MRKTLFVLLGCTMLFTYWACNKNSNPVGSSNGIPSISGSYFPLAVGDEWTYDTWQDSDNVKVAGSDKIVTIAVVKTTTVNGILAYGMGVPGYDTAVAYYAVDAQGNHLIFYDTSFGKGRGVWEIYTALSNTVKGQKVRIYLPLNYGIGFGGTVDTIRQVDTTIETFMGDTLITVQAGTFYAEHYKDTLIASSAIYDSLGIVSYAIADKFYARNVGLIKESDADVFTAGTYSSSSSLNKELVSYSLK